MFLQLEDRELLVFVLSLIAFIVVFRERKNLGGDGQIALATVTALVLALAATNIEEVVENPAAEGLNLAEHVFYALHTFGILFWIFRNRRRRLAR